MNAQRVTSQVACEYIANHPDDGWDRDTIVAVMTTALANDVALLYVSMVRDVLNQLDARQDADR